MSKDGNEEQTKELSYYDRVIIAVSEVSKENWRIIYKFIKAILVEDNIVSKTDSFLSLKKITIGISLKRNLPSTDKTPDAYSLYGETNFDIETLHKDTCFSIIYKKENDSEDFAELVPFTLIQHEFGSSVALGIDICSLSDTESYKFKCSNFFILHENIKPKLGNKSVYFIEEIVNEKTGETRPIIYSLAGKGKGGNSNYKGAPSRRFLPLIKITESNFRSIFVANGTCDSKDLKFVLESIDKIKKDWESNRAIKFIWPKLKLIFEKSQSPFEQWIESGYLYSLGEKLKDFTGEKIESVRKTLQIYKNSVIELVQNIIFHAGKEGLLYCVFDEKRNIKKGYRESILDFDTYKDNTRFLRIGVFDYCENGIVDTFCDYLKTDPYPGASEDINSLSLRSFFDTNSIVVKGLTRLEMRYAARLGIKAFVKTIINHKGFFGVESNFHNHNGSGKKQIQTVLKDNVITLTDEVESVFANGTHYEIVLPIVANENDNTIPHQSDSLMANSYFNVTNEKKMPFSWLIRNTNDIDFSYISNSASKKEQIDKISEVGNKVLRFIQENKSLDGIVWDFEGKEIDYNTVFKLISFIQLNSNTGFKRIIFVNTTERFIKGLYDLLNALIIDNEDAVWNKESAIVVYSESMYSMIIWGETKDELYYINQESQRFNYNYFFQESSIIDWNSEPVQKRIDDNTKELVKQFVLPYDILINADEENQASLFECFLNRLLKRKINPNNLGFLVNHENTYIGNKIIVKNYYEADMMFQNDYFTERFAYLIAQNIKDEIISKNQQNKKLVLIGYNHYSEVLLKSIEKWLKIKMMYNESSFVREVNLAIFIEEKDTFSDDSFFDFDIDKKQNGENTKQDILKNPKEFLFATIVPIGSTLSTNDKIISLFRQWYKDEKEGDNSKFLMQDDRFVYNHCVIVVRDSDLGEVSVQEKGQRWESVDLSERVIRTGYTNAKEIHFSTQIAKATDKDNTNSNWAKRLNKEISFKEDWWREEYVNYTENSSINSQNLMGFPRIESSELNEVNHSIELDRLYDLRDDIYKGHIEVLNCHHKYYIDTEKFVKRKNAKLDNWLQEEVGADGVFDQGNLNVIITPNVERESDLIFKIKESIFNGNALIIYLDVNNWRNNMVHKLSYLKNFKKSRVKFHYVDQAFLTGETYHKSKSYLFSILDDTTIGFASIITVVNRLSYAKNLEIHNDVKGKFFSFIKLHYPGSKEGEHDCELCQLDEYYKKLSTRTVLDSCNDAIIKNRKKLIVVQKNNKDSKQCSKRGFIRLVLTHEIYYRIAEIVQQYSLEAYDFINIYSDMEKELDGLFGQLSQSSSLSVQDKVPKSTINQKIDDWLTLKCMDDQCGLSGDLNAVFIEKLRVDKRISFLKVISSPPLSKYIAIRKYAHEKLLYELYKIISRTNNEQNDFVYDDLKLIKSILKSLSFLKSNALVRKDVIIGVWRVLGKILCNLEKERNSIEKNLGIIDKHMHELKLSINQPQLGLFSYSEEELKNDIIKMKGLRKELNKDLDRLKEDEIIRDFSQDVQFFIKNAIVEDDAKSTFLGELLRQGEEMKSFDNVVISKTRLLLRTIERNDIEIDDNSNGFWSVQRDEYNDLFCCFNSGYDQLIKNNENHFLKELENKKQFQQEYNSFLIWLFYDNTTIIRKTLNNFVKDIENNYWDVLYNKDNDLNDFKVFKERIDIKKKEFIENVIQKEYYYSSFIPYLSNEDGIDYVGKLLYVTYAKLKLDDLTANKHKTNIENDMHDLMEIFAAIMGADAAFWTMKERKKNEEKLDKSNQQAKRRQVYPISIYDNNDNNKWENVMYNMTSFYTIRLYNQKKPHYPLVPTYSLRPIHGERRCLGKNSLGVYAITENQEEKEPNDNKKTIVSCITFLYEDGNPIVNNDREFRIQFQELGRLLLLLKKDISEYVVNYLLYEKVFDLWVEKLRNRMTNLQLVELNRATNHFVTLGGWDFDNLSKNEYLKIYNGLIILSNVTIRHLYAYLIEHKEIKIYEGKSELKMSEVFSDKFISLLQVLSSNKLHDMGIEIGQPPDNIRIGGLKTVFQSYIIKLLIYFDQHFDTKKTEIQFCDTYFEIKCDYRKKIIVGGMLKADFNRKYNRSAIYTFLSKPNPGNIYDLTLLTFPFYLDPLGMRCKMGFDEQETFFSIRVYYPINKLII